MRTPKRSLLAGTAAAALIVAPVSAMAAPNLQQDDKWLSLSGNVVDVEGSIFTLDYGEGLVTVEMDDWDWYDETGSLMPGESVVVYGEVDNDLFEQATIEASSVYVSNRNTYYYANAADEETPVIASPVWVGTPAIDYPGTSVTVSGTVTDVNGRNVTVDAGGANLTVDTSALYYNPVDDVGIPKVDEGDLIQANGQMEAGLFENRQLKANSITVLFNDTNSSS
ncbi:hypothetical protein [Parvibaculum sp.]|jgi:uncharacterized protein YdeI (BOF family)|uniref:hypothetical protein n=1 Tax=Parvibaculum sp. TaxID=2024848 RepID=UPI001B151AE5|nr:hypothetical protein [Parvibaculum sp.]MBO6635487.1 hypothetical protein [Parvibaculum sp.]MBO6677041.1 hypothetical protein [Parvibaculum sp.]MBO6685982.1 hypothetical protein [Parvibaculum sp.]